MATAASYIVANCEGRRSCRQCVGATASGGVTAGWNQWLRRLRWLLVVNCHFVELETYLGKCADVLLFNDIIQASSWCFCLIKSCYGYDMTASWFLWCTNFILIPTLRNQKQICLWFVRTLMIPFIWTITLVSSDLLRINSSAWLKILLYWQCTYKGIHNGNVCT